MTNAAVLPDDIARAIADPKSYAEWDALHRMLIDAGTGQQFRSVVAMNEPDHMKYRMLTQAWFVPKNLRQIEERLRKLARTYVDKLAATGGECDFVSEIAVHYPLI